MDVRLAAELERLYAAVPEELVAVVLGLGVLSLLARMAGLRRGHLVSRPRALWGLIATTGGMAMFYVSLLAPGAPEAAAARGGVVRMLLIFHGLALVHWNFEYVKLALRGWRTGG